MLLLDRRRFSILLLLLLVSASSFKSIETAFGLDVRTLNDWYRVELWLVAFFCFIFLSIDRLFVLYELWHALYFARIEAFAFNPFAKKEHFFFREQCRAISCVLNRSCTSHCFSSLVAKGLILRLTLANAV